MEPCDIPDKNATLVYVGNLDKRVTDTMMLNILKSGVQPSIADKVISANMFSNDINNPNEGYCFVQFADNQSASLAMGFLNGRDFCGKKVKVSWAMNSPNGVPKLIGTSVSIYCGNLDDEINEEDLKVAFDPFGEIINVKVVRDPVTNRSKNIAFISFTNKADAEKAIKDMSGAMLRTRPIKTNWATRNQNQKREEQPFDEVCKGASPENTTVYAGGIPSNCTDEQIRSYFEDYGKIVDIRIFHAKNYAFIKYDTHENAAKAICKTNGTELHGSCLKCWWGKDGASDTGNHGNYNNQNNYNSGSNNSSNYSQNNSQDQNNPYGYMTPQQQQQYMQYIQCHPYYQQQYYQYWMQQYQQQMQNGGGQQGGGGYQQNNYQQHQQRGGYQQNYQNQ